MNGLELRRRARKHYPGSRHNQVSWLRAVAYLRTRNLWVIEGGTPKMVSDLPRSA